MNAVNSVLGGVGSILEKAGGGFEDFLEDVRTEHIRNMIMREPVPAEEPGIVERTAASVRKLGSALTEFARND